MPTKININKFRNESDIPAKGHGEFYDTKKTKGYKILAKKAKAKLLKKINKV